MKFRDMCIGILVLLFAFGGVFIDTIAISCVGLGLYIGWVLIDFLDWLHDRKKVKK